MQVNSPLLEIDNIMQFLPLNTISFPHCTLKSEKSGLPITKGKTESMQRPQGNTFYFWQQNF